MVREIFSDEHAITGWITRMNLQQGLEEGTAGRHWNNQKYTAIVCYKRGNLVTAQGSVNKFLVKENQAARDLRSERRHTGCCFTGQQKISSHGDSLGSHPHSQFVVGCDPREIKTSFDKILSGGFHENTARLTGELVLVERKHLQLGQSSELVGDDSCKIQYVKKINYWEVTTYFKN